MMRKLIGLLICMLLLIPVSNVFPLSAHNTSKNQTMPANDGTEYWALLVGVNEFRFVPSAYLPGNDRIVKELKNTLLVSGQWQEDHIRILTGKDATKRNIIKGLKWLAEKGDEDDICFFYLSTHGMISKDMYPKDEDDYVDEYALPYDAYIKLPIFGIRSPNLCSLRDDEFNRLFSNLHSKGLCAIFETCFSGGFNDPPRSTIVPKVLNFDFNKKISAEHWMNEMGNELSGPGRVIMMSANEKEIAQGNCFGYFAIEAMQGKCDTNNDSICTAEEIFTYASNRTTSWLKEYKNWDQHPQIYDDYPGELPLTTKNLPPGRPEILLENTIGNTTQEYHNIITASDPENEKIQYHLDWGDNNKEVTSLYNSDTNVSIAHTWATEGTYNVWIEPEDEHHAMTYQFGLPYHFTVIMCGEHLVDQYQTKIYQPEGFYDCMMYNAAPSTQCMQAQSFIPSSSTLTKVDVWVGICSLYNIMNNITYPLELSIRSSLNESDLTSASAVIPIQNLSYNTPPGWTSFDVPDITVTPGQTYYIVLRQDHEDNQSISYWLYGDPDYPSYPNHNEDPYLNGQAYQSTDGGLTWAPHTKYADDFCFVTYGS
jgi:hypothetical protein